MNSVEALKKIIADYEAKVLDADARIKAIRADRDTYIRMSDELKKVIASLGDQSGLEHSGRSEVVTTEEKTETSAKHDFPLFSSRAQQIIWIIEEHFGRAVRRSEVEQVYTSKVGKKGKSIKFVFRGLVLKGKLIGNKYNRNNKLTFYGMEDWVDKGKYFKAEYLPHEVGRDFNIETVDVVSYNEDKQPANDVFKTLGME